MKDLSSLFVLKYNRPLDVKALSEIFSNYMSKELELGASLQSTIKEKNKTLSPRNIVSWISLLDNLEKTIGLSMSNKYELARHLQATVILGEEDISANFLIYDYKREYLSYFDKHYKLIYETFIGSVKELFALAGEELSDKMISHLLYCLFITWENLFLKISHSRRKLKLLVIERSYNNVGNFLKAYFVEFFDIVNFAELEITTIDLTALEKDYDVIVTDVILERSFQTEILFFNQMIPSVVADKLNAFLRLKIGEDKLFSKINITI